MWWKCLRVESKNIYLNQQAGIMAHIELSNSTKAVKDSSLQWLHQNKGSTQLSLIWPNKIISMMFKLLWEHDDWATCRRKTVFEKGLLLRLSAKTVIVKQTQNDHQGQYYL